MVRSPVMPLSGFHPLIADWFRAEVGTPTDVQVQAWPAIQSHADVLVAAPTGSGKTLAAFLSCIDSLFQQALARELEDQTQVLYVSPLKALSNDVQKNLQKPLVEIGQAALQQGLLMPELRVLVRTGDTPMTDRQQMLKRPPHILVTTPESLFILLTAEKSRRMLRTVRTVIVDEIHALAPNKRGAHLALSLERLDALTFVKPQRIGLSATQRPIETVARFLVGNRGALDVTRETLNVSDSALSPQPTSPSQSHPLFRDKASEHSARLVSSESLASSPCTPHPVPCTPRCTIIDIGYRRELDLAIEVPRDELSAIATNAIWADVYDRVAQLVQEHRSTLVFVNTRRLAERVAHSLEERLQDLGPDVVAAHHGSLSRKIRLQAEERLKAGTTRVVIATASLELGIDVGAVDLVCQIGSPRAIATCVQRVGRAGHWIKAVPKGRLFALTRDELLECAALVRAIRAGLLDRIEVLVAPLDILAQQIVAAAAGETWRDDELFALCRRAYPYRDLERSEFDQIVRMLADGIATHRGRGQAHVFHDRTNGRLKGRRGARLAAITSGGAIPDTANYAVVAEPDGTVVGSVDEDFAVESLAGDIMLLGNTSWRIKGVEAGKVRVEDAQGASPNIPFWRGEAPSRTAELSAEVAALRQDIADRLSLTPQPSAHSLHSESSALSPQPASPAIGEVWPTQRGPRLLREASESSAPSSVLPLTLHPSLLTWLKRECGLDLRGAQQAIEYVLAGRTILGVVPTQDTIVAERFFDESGGMQLVIHAPFGGRINRAWGLALRKRFCVTFDFELQATATDNGIVVSLGERHSFPLESVFAYVHSQSVREVLIQAMLQAPMFTTRWRWNVSRALLLLRFVQGKKVPPQIQRMKAEDLMAAVFPDALACQDNIIGERTRQVPDHPLVKETMRDCLTDAMDLDGLRQVLEWIERGAIRCVAVDTPSPSPFSHEILNANPYAFLDNAPLEERRARAVEMRQTLPPALAGQIGALDPSAIEEVRRESWPIVRDADELHDALLTLVWIPEPIPDEWAGYLQILVESCRAVLITPHPSPLTPYRTSGYIAAENRDRVEQLFADGDETVLDAIALGWLESTGPTTAEELADRLRLSSQPVFHSMLRLEGSGQVLRGTFREGSGVRSKATEEGPPHPSPLTPHQIEWCHRRLLARIHRLTIGRLRKEIKPITASHFMCFLMQWHHVAPGARLHGETGLLEAIKQLAGFEAPASAWEPHLLRVRLGKYEPEMLDRLCLSGAVSWGRLSPHPRLAEPVEDGHARRIVPTRVAPIALFPREDGEWLLDTFQDKTDVARPHRFDTLSAVAQTLRQVLAERGACFFVDLVRATGHLASEIEEGLWELSAAGLVTADGFDNLRALFDPHRRLGEGRARSHRPRHAAGRWSLLRTDAVHGIRQTPPSPNSALSPQHSALVTESVARRLLRRYGVVFRDLLAREGMVHSWRDLLVQYRRMEMAGEVRGGRFVAGFVGEQFALPEAVESMRAMEKGAGRSTQDVKISACDPLNLAGIILPGPRIPAVATNFLIVKDGVIARVVVGRVGEMSARKSAAANAAPG